MSMFMRPPTLEALYIALLCIERVAIEHSGTGDLAGRLFAPAGVVELADTQDLGSCAFGRVGSSPTFRTGRFFIHPWRRRPAPERRESNSCSL
ncbi:hypothetical protein MIC448_530061 [Microbacterium sp. C448]|nr:hypothetical protein MIC448_530061 [Microbacterium sp. C448]